jgi:hypothetical protein
MVTTAISIYLEVASKPQIRFKGKAQADREGATYVQYVSIYRRSATQPLEPFEPLNFLIMRCEIPLL